MDNDQPQEVHGRIPAITKHNLLSKICFLRFGSSLDEAQDEFRSELYGYLRELGTRVVTHQAIQYWFEGHSHPSRTSALGFLRSYIQTKISYENLSNDQKKVYDQTLRHLDRQISGSKAGGELVRTINNSRLVINLTEVSQDLSEFSDAICGSYFLYRERLTQDREKDVSRDLVVIYREGRGVRFENWHRIDGVSLSVFEGSVALIGDILWLFGISASSPLRLRTLCFKHIISPDERRRGVRWGILTSDLPMNFSHDPVACRVLMTRLDHEVSNSRAFAEGNVGHITLDTSAPRDAAISRLINNAITAFSRPSLGTTTLDGDGGDSRDHVLRVNQETLERLFDRLLKP